MGYRELRAKWLALRARLTGKHLRIGKGARIASTASVYPGHGRIEIGDHVELHRGSILAAYDGSITIGDHVSVQPYSILYGTGALEIGNDVRIAAHVVIVPANHRYDDRAKPIRKQGMAKGRIVIEDDVWIGAGVRILSGAHIAKGCVIAANAVVNGPTEPYGIYGGVPAKRIGER